MSLCCVLGQDTTPNSDSLHCLRRNIKWVAANYQSIKPDEMLGGGGGD